MPELVRLYIRNVIAGFVLALGFVGLLLWFDVARLWTLVSETREGPVAVVMLVVFNTIVFSGVQFGIAVMRMAEREERPGGGLRGPEAVEPPGLAPVRAVAPAGPKAKALPFHLGRHRLRR